MSEEVAKEEVIEIIIKIAEKIVKNTDKLSELDSKIGDSDHGDNMKRGFKKIIEEKDKIKDKTTIKEVFNKVAEFITFEVGGSAGPLFGNLFIEFGKTFNNNKKLNINKLPEAFSNSMQAVQDLGNAEVGDKTMVDTLNPVVEYLMGVEVKNLGCEDLLYNIKQKAKEGMESTRDISANKGRASYLNERSIGHIDPGAYSTYLIIETVYEYYN